MNGRWELLKKTCPAKAGRDKERRRIFQPPAGDRGFALVFTLLLLGMMSLIALAMVLSSSSDMLINGYYRNARGSSTRQTPGSTSPGNSFLTKSSLKFPPPLV